MSEEQKKALGLDMKVGLVCKAEATASDMTKINRQALVELKAEDVFAFRIAACNDQVDRDNEQFTLECLKGLAKLYVGKTVVMDHAWSAKNQTARIYDGGVEPMTGGGNQLVLNAYMLRNDTTADTIAAIEGGILREVSVGCRTAKALCSICGADKRKTWCDHAPGRVYNGTRCVVQLDEPTDAYEVSFCAVPVQAAAGVVKSYGGEDNKETPPAPAGDPIPPEEKSAPQGDLETQKALALLELEENQI